MPNGGSDCCGTCWFNEVNKGKAGHPPAPFGGQAARCTIRDLEIPDPFWTYCANHPHHNPQRIDLPLGPVYVASDEVQGERVVWKECPDTEEVRMKHLQFLASLCETPSVEYPMGCQIDDEIIRQAGKFADRRALPELRRIVQFNPLASPPGENPFEQTRIRTVALAVEALARIAGDEALPEIEKAVRVGLGHDRGQSGKSKHTEDLAQIRFYAVRGLAHVSRKYSLPLLKQAIQDPDQKVSGLANMMLRA